MTAHPALCAPLALAALLLAAAPAEAHRLKIFATAEGATIAGTAYFAGGGPAVGVAGRVLDPEGRLAGEFRTDATGAFRVEARLRQDHRLTVDAGDGHAAAYTVSADELPASLPAGSSAAPQAVSPPVTATAIDTDLAAIIERSVARQIRPLREQLDATEARIRLHDVLGGIGWIAGLFGAGAWMASRRRTQ